MIGLEDRRNMVKMIDLAHHDGACLSKACKLASFDARILQRWKAQDGLAKGDRRPDAVHPAPAHALTPEERAVVLELANEPRFANIPPARIVATFADEGTPRASEHWYNFNHQHSGIRYVSPTQRHAGEVRQFLAQSHAVCLQARECNPSSWSRHTLNWNPIEAVALNPGRDAVVRMAVQSALHTTGATA